MEEYSTATLAPLEGIDPLPASEFFSAGRNEADFGGELGLRKGPSFTPAEVERIRDLIRARLIESAREQSDEAAEALKGVPLDQVHEVTSRYDHGRLLSKLGRVLDGDAVQEIKAMSFFDYVRQAIGDFYLADEDGVGHEEISFRIVRPNREEDVGYLHRDAWFWDYYNLEVPPGERRAKMWTLICGDPQNAGLRLAPGSHRMDLGYRSEKRGNKLVFEPDFDWRDVGLRQYVGAVGEPIFFNYGTLHTGSVNRGGGCRVSIETTIIYR